MPEVVKEIGAAAGLAAVAGLAVLSAFYFAQAPDVKRLREWAGRAPERSGSAPASPTGLRPARPAASRTIVPITLAGLLVLGGAASYGVTRLGGDDPRAEPKHERAAVKPAKVTVAVLNATTVPGLAASLGDQLAAAGFRKGTIDTFSDQQLAESVVQYSPGQRAAAKVVGRRVGVARLEPVSADGRAIAPEATVIVIAGADRAQ